MVLLKDTASFWLVSALPSNPFTPYTWFQSYNEFWIIDRYGRSASFKAGCQALLL